jgi:acetyl-CoA acetyltransferase
MNIDHLLPVKLQESIKWAPLHENAANAIAAQHPKPVVDEWDLEKKEYKANPDPLKRDPFREPDAGQIQTKQFLS